METRRTNDPNRWAGSAVQPENLPLVAIVGRPNVGKSTLLNRVIGRRAAIVEERPGVTRDRKEVLAQWNGIDFRLADTGGWMQSGSALDDKVSHQSEVAMGEANVVLLVLDSTVGLTEDDAQVAERLRRSGAPVIVVANKVDDQSHEVRIWDFMTLGLGEPMPVSALHGRGAGDLLDRVVGQLTELGLVNPDSGTDESDESAVEGEDPIGDGVAIRCSVALVGRPNVGKSTLFNRLIGEERSVVHDMPGTTRDSVDTVVDGPLGRIRFVDTAGMRRKARISEGTEWFSMVRALQSVDTADVALLVIDSTEGVTHQDQRLAERVDAAGCPILIVMNKWEILDADQKDRAEYHIKTRLGFLGEAPIMRISGLTGKGVQRLIPALEEAMTAYSTRIPTARVNDVVRRAQQAQPAPHGARILYATQGAINPPTFTLFTNADIPPSYVRYIERQLRTEFDLGATALKLRVRRRG